MDIKISIKNVISNKNPFAVARREQMRKSLQMDSISLFCANCMGGMLFHDLNLEFKSPTVNLMILQPQFVNFMLHMHEYVKAPLKFVNCQEVSCPVAEISGSGGVIRIFFTHYNSQEEAEKKWHDRIERIDYDNIFVICAERDGLLYSDMKRLSLLKVRGLLVFTAKKYDLPYALQIPKYSSEEEVGNLLKRRLWNDGREYEKYFDFVKWFNEANGENYDIKEFVK